jgi:hypothetical protein
MAIEKKFNPHNVWQLNFSNAKSCGDGNFLMANLTLTKKIPSPTLR